MSFGRAPLGKTALGAVEVAAGGTQTLTPSLFTNSQTFFAPTVAATYSLTPTLYTNTQTFFAATVTPGVVTLTPALLTNGSTFFGATVTGGAERASPAGRPRRRRYFIELPDGRLLYGEPAELTDIIVAMRDDEPEVKAPEIKVEPKKKKKIAQAKDDPPKPEPVMIAVKDWLAEARVAGRLAEIARNAMQDDEDELFLMMAA